MTPDPLDLDRLEELAKEATPGPWAIEGDFLVTLDPTENEWERRALSDLRYWHLPWVDANAAYIAAANPETILRLIALARAALRPDADDQSGEAKPS